MVNCPHYSILNSYYQFMANEVLQNILQWERNSLQCTFFNKNFLTEITTYTDLTETKCLLPNKHQSSIIKKSEFIIQVNSLAPNIPVSSYCIQ